ncbi:hypothetical protein L1049_010013 [Liquidambar formosana]|uniref:Transmembrane protein n=1 Tax=Liquidambar formosana TaxID=63359 RepID=A0AAP0R3Y7_LIQFO
MASFNPSPPFSFFILAILVTYMAANTCEARKTYTLPRGGASKMPTVDKPPLEPSGTVALGVVLKGRIPASGPSHKGHKVPNFTRHLQKRGDSSVRASPDGRSVPSPGVGH